MLGNSLKYISLILCVLQNSALVIQIRYTRVQGGPRYYITTAVLASEFFKVFCCVLAILIEKGPKEIFSEIFSEGLGTLKVAIPAGIYAFQNNLLYYGLSNLEAPVYQVSNQLKVFTTAIFFVFLLQKHLSLKKWFSLVLLFVGISLVQVSSLTPSAPSSVPVPPQNPVLGAAAVFLASLTSGFAGVYFEKIMKSTPATSVWARNAQLGFFGFFFAGGISLYNDYALMKETGIFYGWNWGVFSLVFNHAVGGLIVAFVVRYADNILKGFASSISIILSSIISLFLFDFKLSWLFVLGTVMVLMACYFYQQQEPVNDEKKNSVSV